MANVLILGGCGFIGRNLVEYLHKEKLAKKIRVADKALPETSGLSPEQQALFKEIEFQQANLTKPTMVTKAFALESGSWDYVFNLAGETKFGQSEAVYDESVVGIVKVCLAEAKPKNIKKWIELSSGQCYDSGKSKSKEDEKLKPWTNLAKSKALAEKAVQDSGVPHTIIRAATVYGPGDITGMTPRIICAATYVGGKAGEKMTFLWDGDLKVHTVHVADVVRAMWFCATTDACTGQVYNLVDDSDTTQEKIAAFLEAIFGIKTEFFGLLKSKAATGVAMKTVAETANETHMEPWGEILKEKGLTMSKLSPFLDEELLYNNSLSLEGEKIKKAGFSLTQPKMNKELLVQTIKYFESTKDFPTGLIQ